jgi:hypothetical protein
MPTILPLIIIALGSIALVVLNDWRMVLGGLAAQWLGLTLLVFDLTGGLSSSVLAEVVTASVSIAILSMTLRSLDRIKADQLPGLDDRQRAALRRAEERERAEARTSRTGITDYLWLLAIVLTAGTAGYGLAYAFPIGVPEQPLMALYWIAISGAMALVLQGAYNPVKLSVGLLALFNGIVLLIYLLGVQALGVALLGLLALIRIAMSAILSYAWVVLKTTFLDLDLRVLFDLRSGRRLTETAIVVQGPAANGTGPQVPEPLTDAEIEQPEVEAEQEMQEAMQEAGRAM